MTTILQGDWIEQLRTLPAESVHCVVTSPPYWGLRDYGVAGQLGLEKSPTEYVAKLVAGFREVRRVLRKDGTLWLNLGDSYASAVTKWGGSQGNNPCKQNTNRGSRRSERADLTGLKYKDLIGIPWRVAFALQADGWFLRSDNIWEKPNPMPQSVRDRCATSHEYVFLMTKTAKYYFDHEAIKEPCSPNTHARISQNVAAQVGSHRANGGLKNNGPMRAVMAGSTRKLADRVGNGKRNLSYETSVCMLVPNRNKRSVWRVTTQPFKGAHFATFPPKLVEPCLLAGTSAGGCCAVCATPLKRIMADGKPLEEWKRACGADTNGEYHGQNTKAYQKHKAQPASTVKARILAGMVERVTVGWQPTCKCESTLPPVPCTILDPFGGSGTVAQVAKQHGRNAILIELNPDYIPLIQQRIGETSLIHSITDSQLPA